MVVLYTDLDNTIIYSYKKDIGVNKKNVEIYQGREISFITDKTYELLNIVKNEMLIIPTTTRTIEQYNRIDLGIGNHKYALVCNGGILLVDGQRDESWYRKSLELILPSIKELNKAMIYLEKDSNRIFELRFIEDLFIFTKCTNPDEVICSLKKKLDIKLVDVFNNGEKIYVVPKALSKGKAIKRLSDILKPDYMIAAGDSEFDISLVESADLGLVPFGFIDKYKSSNSLMEMDNEKIFSEALLEESLKIIKSEVY